MKNVILIIKKEFNRFFKDRRMILMIFLPGVLIFCLYTLIGTVMEKVTPSIPEGYEYTAVVVNMPDGEKFKALDSVLDVRNLSVEEAKSGVAEGELDIIVEFPSTFTADVESGASPEVKIYYNSSVDTSFQGYAVVTAAANRRCN